MAASQLLIQVRILTLHKLKTMAALTDNSPMPFGKHKGKAMANVPAIYLIWLFDNGCSHPGVLQYILNNLEALKKEAGRIKR